MLIRKCSVALCLVIMLIGIFLWALPTPLVAQTTDNLLSQNKEQKSSVSSPSVTSKKQEVNVRTSPVTFDGKELFPVQGFKAVSSEERAKAIGERIRRVAEDLTIRSDSITVVDTDISTDVVAGDQIIMSVTDKDSLVAGRTRQDMSREYAEQIRTAVEKYRMDYSRQSILSGALYGFIATVAFIVILILTIKLFRKLNKLIETRYRDRIHAIHVKSIEVVQVQRVRAFINETVSILRFVTVAIIAYTYVHTLLSFFPWTRPFANQLLGYLLVPLRVIGGGIVGMTAAFM